MRPIVLLLTLVYWIFEAEFHIAQLVSHYDAEASPEFLMLLLSSPRVLGLQVYFTTCTLK